MPAKTITCLVACSAAIVQSGCTTEQKVMAHHTKSTFVEPGPSEEAVDLIAGILPLGSVPYDNRSLPQVSPDGQYIATQVGGPPAWETLLASPDRPLAADSRIEIYHLDRRLGEAQLQWVTEPGVLLGRGVDEQGFLIEQPTSDGGRWIGRMSWAGGTRWLVGDDAVNAFAGQGPGRRLAWSRRAGGAEHFDLVISSSGREWTVPADGGDWLMPVWSRSHAGLFALRLADGRLEAAYMDASTPETTRATLQKVTIADQRTRYDAYQCLASYAPPPPASTGAQAEPALMMWHPTMARMGVWLPRSSPAALMLLEPGSIAAVMDATGNMLVATADGVSLQNPADPATGRMLLPGTHVLRTVQIKDWPYLALTPRGDRIGLMAVRLLHD